MTYWEEHWARSQESSLCHLISQILYLKNERTALDKFVIGFLISLSFILSWPWVFKLEMNHFPAISLNFFLQLFKEGQACSDWEAEEDMIRNQEAQHYTRKDNVLWTNNRKRRIKKRNQTWKSTKGKRSETHSRTLTPSPRIYLEEGLRNTKASGSRGGDPALPPGSTAPLCPLSNVEQKGPATALCAEQALLGHWMRGLKALVSAAGTAARQEIWELGPGNYPAVAGLVLREGD